MGENIFKTELYQFVDDGTAKIVTHIGVEDIIADRLKERYFRAAFGFDRKDVVIVGGNIAQRIVESLGKLRIVLPIEQIGQEMYFFEFRAISVQT